MDVATVRAMTISQVVDDPEWQAVRKTLIGNWVTNHNANITALWTYLERFQWGPRQVRQVLNVLTGSVHRSGKTAYQSDTDHLRALVRCRWWDMTERPYDVLDPKFSRGII